ncbi:DoxX family protein [Shewanella salipaludis]|uniref:DoxX family protein n=1 Tax=Shewanella salipaludis TaxID=2723052 RepID=A0A972FQL9_9GAMM|nr:DoxX family protein [Shewanella salipaludis]NMH64345.1 DoxX family protein [Shewanella salipaludis]
MIELKTAPYAALWLRIATGVLFLAHGLTKVLVFTIPGTVGYFESLGLPAIVAYLTIFAELGGGLALILGVATRAVSLALLPVLLGAVWAHSSNGWMFANQGGGWEYPLFWVIAQASLILLGNGAYALKLPMLNKLLGKYA